MEIVHVYTRLRSEFGRPCLLSDRSPELTLDLLPDPGLSAQFILRTPRNQATQTRCDMSEHQVNTERFETESTGVNHTEGGWPKDVDPNEIEQTVRYRKKVEKDEGFVNSVTQLGKVMVHCIQQNNALDIYQEYCTEEDKGESTEPLPDKTKSEEQREAGHERDGTDAPDVQQVTARAEDDICSVEEAELPGRDDFPQVTEHFTHI
ncbi:dynein axonemal intermediate chain 2-like [Eucyclogobius newberryi]|uniref:dynein axonemal intermediate chain 2-like n=1 Tax=Eucyclogobius newberryi TaxID=166745 RepID=UPI003B5ACBA8